MDHSILSSIRSTCLETIAVDAVRRDILSYYGLTWHDIIKQDRRRDLVFVRHLLAYILKRKEALSIEDISRLLNRDHKAIHHAVKSIQDYLDTDSLGRREEIIIHLRRHGIGE